MGTWGGAHRRAKWGVAVTAVTAMAASMLAYPVEAAVGPTRSITVSPADSIVVVEGLNPADTYTVTVVRDGVAVGSATGSPTTFGVFGALELNHEGEAAGTFCWNGVTPRIQADDEVHVTGPGVADSTTVQHVTVAGNPEPLGDNAFTVTGTLGEGLDLGNLDVLVRLDLTPAAPGDDDDDDDDDDSEVEDADDDSGDWRASSSDPGNTLVLGDDGTTWTATFTMGDGDEDAAPVTPEVLAAAANPRVLEATYSVGTPPPGEDHGGNENTTATVGAEPLPEGCPARDSSAIGHVSPSVINVANQGSDLTVSGVSEATSVTVDVTDTDADVDDSMTTTVDVGTNGTWTATIPGPLAALEGDLEVTAAHSGGQGSVGANTRHVLRDTVAPDEPQSFPGSSSFFGSIQVLLAGTDQIRYTEGDGSQPAPTATTGRRYTGTILLAQTTVIKAVTVDAAGNVSPVLTRTFTRNVPTVPTVPTGPSGPVVTPQVPPPPDTGAATILPLAPGIAKAKSGKRGGKDTATIRWRVPLANGAVVDGYQVRALKIRPGRSARVRAVESVESDVTRLKMALRSGKYRFQVRAVSAAGTSPWSERSAKVTSR